MEGNKEGKGRGKKEGRKGKGRREEERKEEKCHSNGKEKKVKLSLFTNNIILLFWKSQKIHKKAIRANKWIQQSCRI